jgi:hypothetical protein
MQTSVNAKRRSIPLSALRATAKIAYTGQNAKLSRSYKVKRLNPVSAVGRLVVSGCYLVHGSGEQAGNVKVSWVMYF